MQHQKPKKKLPNKKKKLALNNRAEYHSYQANNPLTLYFKKHIEKDKS
jgi:hypothetical protein|tara:strand:- start:803 stop:946 length:144 start_codon:yes stop_codon:yes gene_type:complete